MPDNGVKTVHVISRFDDLREYGINPLTGEACAYMMRVLFDLSASGAELVARFLGISADAFADPWNSTVGEVPTVGSVMLTGPTVIDLAVFAMFYRHNAAFAYISKDPSGAATLPVYGTHEMMHEGIGCGLELIPRRNWAGSYGQPVVGDRNVHQMSGRAV